MPLEQTAHEHVTDDAPGNLPAVAESLPAMPGSTFPPPEEHPLSLEDAFYTALAQNRSLRVVRHNSSIAAREISVEDAQFDPLFGLAVTGGQDDRQLSDLLQLFSAGVLTTVQEQQENTLDAPDTNNIYLRKDLRSGGRVELGYGVEYNDVDSFGPFRVLNPFWDSGVNLHLEQPLLQGAGRSVNEAPIAIARIDYRRTKHEIQAEVNATLFAVSQAYLDVVAATKRYENLHVASQRSRKSLEDERTRVELGGGALPDVTGAEEQYLRILAQEQEAELERRIATVELLRLIGLPNRDELAVAHSIPVDLGFNINSWEEALANALSRPELLAQQEAINAASVNAQAASDLLLPDLRLEFDYRQQGLDDRLDQSFGEVTSFSHSRWQAGLVYETPLGRRAGRSTYSQARLIASREQALMAEIENDIISELRGAWKNLDASAELLRIARSRKEAADRNVKVLRELLENRKGTLESVLLAETRAVDADVQLAIASVEYQKAELAWAYAQGVLGSQWVLFSETPTESE